MKQLKSMRRVIFITVLLLLLIPATTVLAFDSRDGEEVVIGADEVVEDDLYVTAGVFTLNGTVEGDVVVFGGEITINGTIEGDLISSGQSIVINGKVLEDVYAAGYVVELGPKASIGDDLIAGAYSVVVKEGGVIESDLLCGSKQVRMAGTVEEDFIVGAVGLDLQGSVGGKVDAEVGGSAEDSLPFDPMSFIPNMPPVPTITDGLTVGAKAKVGGDFIYHSPVEVSIPSSAVAGDVDFTEVIDENAEQEGTLAANMFLNWLLNSGRRMLALLVVGLLLAWQLPSWVKGPSQKLGAKPMPSLGWGALVLLVFPPAVLLFLIILVLVSMALSVVLLNNLSGSLLLAGVAVVLVLVAIFILVLTYLTKVIAGYWGGRFILSRIQPSMAENTVVAVLIGVLIVGLLLSIPFLGFLISLAISLFGLGALWIMWRERPKAALPEAVVAAAPVEDVPPAPGSEDGVPSSDESL